MLHIFCEFIGDGDQEKEVLHNDAIAMKTHYAI